MEIEFEELAKSVFLPNGQILKDEKSWYIKSVTYLPEGQGYQILLVKYRAKTEDKSPF